MIKKHSKLVAQANLLRDLQNEHMNAYSMLYEMGVNKDSLYYIEALMKALEDGISRVIIEELKVKEDEE